MDFSSLAFITVLSLINADGNITSISLQQGIGCEGNPLAAPLAEGNGHYINSAAAIGTCILVHDELKDSFGTKDVFTIGVMALETATISSWVPCRKADIGWELGLSEAEFLITSSIFNIKF